MSQDTFRDIVRVVQVDWKREIFSFGVQYLSKSELQLHYGDFRQAAYSVLLQKHF